MTTGSNPQILIGFEDILKILVFEALTRHGNKLRLFMGQGIADCYATVGHVVLAFYLKQNSTYEK